MRPLTSLLLSFSALLLPLSVTARASAQQPTPPSAERVRGGMFDASDPGGLARFLEKMGYRVELATDARGDPMITGRIHATDYSIQFYECERGAFCNSVQFFAQGPKPAALTAEICNSFNMRWRYVRVTIDQSQVRLQMDLNLDGGVTADNLEDTLDIWKQLVEIFERDVLQLRQ